MPQFEYECASGHRRDRLFKSDARDTPFDCAECSLPMKRLEISRSHVAPDGVYSYAPNIGDPERFERQQALIKERKHGGARVMPRAPSKADLERWGNDG